MVEAAGPCVETRDLVGPARSRIPILAAALVAGRKRQAASNDHGCIPLPSSEQQVRRSGSVAQELLAPAERQLVNRRQNQDAVPVEILTSVTLRQIRLVAAVVDIGPGVGVEPVELQE